MDNSEPQNIESVIELWDELKKEYPNAEIQAGTLDDFVNLVEKNTYYSKIPIFKGEMGNTWLYGTGADPYRTSTFREIRRTMMEFEKTNPGTQDFLQNILRRLMKIPEHNWGLSDSQYLDKDHYQVYWSNSDFHAHRNDPQYQALEAGWAEARSYLQAVPDLIEKSADQNQNVLKLSTLIRSRLDDLKPQIPNKDGFKEISYDLVHKTTFFDVQFDDAGTIVYLQQKAPQNYSWASTSKTIGEFIYQTFTYEDYHIFNQQYNPYCLSYGDYVCMDFAKYNMNNTYSVRKDWTSQLLGIFSKNFTDRYQFLLELKLDPVTAETWGGPRSIFVTYSFSNTKPTIDIEFQWFQKTATRLPEAMWFKLNPIVGDPTFWSMDVMGSPVSPYEVVVNGSRHLHAIWSGIEYKNQNIKLSIISKDAHLVAPGDTDHLLRFDGENLPNVEGGMHFNLYNNLWGTAFNQWYDQDAKFRFSLTFG